MKGEGGLAYDGRYSDDRKSLALEIRETLRARGHWCPETDGPDLIMAVGKALDANRDLREALGELLAAGRDERIRRGMSQRADETRHEWYEARRRLEAIESTAARLLGGGDNEGG